MKVRKRVKKAKGLGNPVLGVRIPVEVFNAFVAKCGGMREAHEAVRKYVRGAVHRKTKTEAAS